MPDKCMSKAEQLKALREGKSSRGSREAVTGRPTRVAPVRASASKDARSGSVNGAKGEPRRSVGERASGGVATTPREIIRRKGRPRIEDKDKTIEAAAPWIAMGMSRRSWYRRQAEKRAVK